MLQPYFYADYGFSGFFIPDYLAYWSPWDLPLQYQPSFVHQQFGIQREDQINASNSVIAERDQGSFSTIKQENLRQPSRKVESFLQSRHWSTKNIQKSTKHDNKKVSKYPIQIPNRNTESNFCNQALGFIVLSKKSETFLRRLLRASESENIDKLCCIYYSYTKVFKRHQRMYLNRKFLFKISTKVDCFQMKEVRESPVYQEGKILIEQFVRITRIMLRHFVESVSPLALIHSKKLQKGNRLKNFARRQEIRGYLRENVCKQQ